MQAFRAAGKSPPVPDLPDGGEYLVEAMVALGPVRESGEGLRPTDWPEIYPFARATRRVEDPFELEALHRMCSAYLSGYRAGESPFSIPPMER